MSKIIIIIGAGPCGLGAAWRLQEVGYSNYLVVESNNFPGGLATSVTDKQGFTWDIGSHVTHSHYKYFDTVFNNVMDHAYIEHTRKAWIWQYNMRIPYPFQHSLQYLPQHIKEECQRDLTINKIDTQPSNYEDWLIAHFGHGIAKHFQIPYNRKVWAYPLSKMNTSWVGDRVAKMQQSNHSGWGPNYKFVYPTYGGTGDIWNRVGEKCKDHIVYTKTVVHIDTKKHTVHFSDHTNLPYSTILSTLPLDMLVTKIIDPPLSSTTPLHASSLVIVGLGIKGAMPKNVKDNMWTYFATKEFVFFRVCFLKSFSPNTAPDGQWSIMCEVSYSEYQPLPQKDIVPIIIKSLSKHKFLNEKDIVDLWVHTVDKGYPTPTLGRDRYIEKVFSRLEKLNIYSRGRFGLWKYEVSNQDHVFMQGVEWVNKLLFNEPELTINHPNKANKLMES